MSFLQPVPLLDLDGERGIAPRLHTDSTRSALPFYRPSLLHSPPPFLPMDSVTRIPLPRAPTLIPTTQVGGASHHAYGLHAFNPAGGYGFYEAPALAPKIEATLRTSSASRSAPSRQLIRKASMSEMMPTAENASFSLAPATSFEVRVLSA